MDIHERLTIVYPLSYRKHFFEDLFLNAPSIIAKGVKDIAYSIIGEYSAMEADKRCGFIRSWDLHHKEDEKWRDQEEQRIFEKLSIKLNPLIRNLNEKAGKRIIRKRKIDLSLFEPAILHVRSGYIENSLAITLAFIPKRIGIFEATNVPFVGIDANNIITVGQAIFNPQDGFSYCGCWFRGGLLDAQYLDKILGENRSSFCDSLCREIFEKSNTDIFQFKIFHSLFS